MPAGSLEARRSAWIREELYERAARHQKEFMSLLSPDVERARRLAASSARRGQDRSRRLLVEKIEPLEVELAERRADVENGGER